jgi:oligosaccharide repeat unit polymerase
MIEDILFLLLWMMLPFIWHYLLKAAGLSFSRVTIPSFIILFFYLYQYIGFPFLYFQLDPYRAQTVTDKYLMMVVFTYTSITITLMIAGYIIGNRHFGKLIWEKTNLEYVNNIGGVFFGGVRQNFGLMVLISICVAVLFVYLSIIGIQKLAFSIALGFGEEITHSAARSSMGNSFIGKYHWYKLFMNDLMRFSFFALFAQSLVKKTTTIRIFLIPVFLLTVFVMVMSTEKAPMANLLIAIFLVYIFVKIKGNVPLLKLGLLGGIILFILVVFYLIFMGSQNVSDALSAVFSRTFTGQMEPAYHYLEIFPEQIKFLGGRSFPNPQGIFPFEHFKLTQEVMVWLYPALIQNAIVGSMPTVYWGEMYANFGILGVLIPPFFVGYILYGFNAIIFRLQKTPLSIALMVWLLLHLSILSGTSLSNYFLDIYMIGVLISFLVLTLYSGKGLIQFQKRIKQS